MREKNSMRVVFSWYSGARKSAFYFSLCALLFALCSFTDAQQQGKLPKIGWLEVRPDDARTSFELFQRELRALGYVDGRSVVFEYRNAGNKLDRLPALADELVRLGVNLVFAVPAPAAVAAKNATTTIPIVFLGGFDPIAAGLVDSLARPGGNITGFSANIPMVAGKRLELLKETVRKLSRVAALWDPQNSGSAQQWKESQVPAKELGLQLHSIEISSPEKFAYAFKEATRTNSEAIILMESQFFYSSNQKQLADLALRIGQCRRNRMPAIENHRGVSAAVPVAPGRPGGRFSALFEGFAAAAAEGGFSVAIAHGPACVTGSGLWQFGRFGPLFGGLPWLTLPWPFAHKRADRERAIGSRY